MRVALGDPVARICSDRVALTRPGSCDAGLLPAGRGGLPFRVARGYGRRQSVAENAPGLLWVAYIFAALLAWFESGVLPRTRKRRDSRGSPSRRLAGGWIFLGKALANFALISVVELATACRLCGGVRAWIYSPLRHELAGVVALGTAGSLRRSGTLVSAMAVRTRFSEVLLPVLLLPTLIPVLVGAVRGTSLRTRRRGPALRRSSAADRRRRHILDRFVPRLRLRSRRVMDRRTTKTSSAPEGVG